MLAQESQEAADEKPPRLELSAWGSFDFRESESATSDVPTHGFNVPFLRIGVKGQLTERVRYGVNLQGDFLDDVKVLDAFADVTLHSRVKVRVGQFKYDFDIAGRRPAHARPLPDVSFITNAVAGSMAGKGTANSPVGAFRDRGVSLLGNGAAGDLKYRWALGVFQGNGRAADNNSDLGFSANLQIEPTRSLLLNLGYLSSDSADEDASTTDEFEAMTFGIEFTSGRFYATGEYYLGERTKGSDTQQVDGFHVLFGYRVADRVDVLTGYHEMQDEKFSPGSDSAAGLEVGVRYFLQRKGRWSGTSIDLSYVARDADAGFQGLTILNLPKATRVSGEDAGDVVSLTLRIRV